MIDEERIQKIRALLGDAAHYDGEVYELLQNLCYFDEIVRLIEEKNRLTNLGAAIETLYAEYAWNSDTPYDFAAKVAEAINRRKAKQERCNANT